MAREALPGAVTSSSLAKAIYKAELPEKFVRELPAQSLYLVIKHNGLLSSADLVGMASLEQCRLLLDLDCWQGDSFDEENFWDWLALTDENSNLDLLKKLLHFVDYKLVALIIDRYVSVIIVEEGTDAAPGDGYYTPDRGRTWINVTNPDSTKQFLLNRFLALIFETQAELFYQLISIKNVATDSMLEEESYQERLKRLSSEGIPEPEFAAQIHAIMSYGEALKITCNAAKVTAIKDIIPIQPIVYDQGLSSPLLKLWQLVKNREELEAELTLITNAALVFYRVDFNEISDVHNIIKRVKGVLTIGLEKLISKSGNQDLLAFYETLGLQGIYKVGLFELYEFRKYAKSISEDQLRVIADDVPLFSLIACAREFVPVIPEWKKLGAEAEKLSTKTYPIESLSELQSIKEFIEQRLATHVQ